MSLGNAFTNAIEAMMAQSNALGVISQNVANINTTGYKTSEDEFQTLLSGADGFVASPTDNASGNVSMLNSANNLLGVQAALTQQVSVQGDITPTDLWSDLAINGTGMFVVSEYTGTDAINAEGQAQGVGVTGADGNVYTTGEITASGTALTGSEPLAYTRDGSISEVTGAPVSGIATLTLGSNASISYDSDDDQTSAGPTQITAYFTDGSQSTISLDFSGLTQTSSGASEVAATADGTATSGNVAGTATSTITFAGSLTADSAAPITTTVPVVDPDGTTENMTVTLTPSTTDGVTSWSVAAEPVHSANPDVYLTTGDGNYLMGWQAVNGVVTPSEDASSLTAVNFVTGSSMAGSATTAMSIEATLPSGTTTAQSLSAPLYDDLGNAQTLQVTFNPTSANNWTVGFAVPSQEAAGTVATPSTADTLGFDDSGNYSSSDSSSDPEVDITWANGTSSAITLDMSQMSQVDGGNFQISNVTQNGVGGGTGAATEPTTNIALQGSLPGGGADGSSYTQQVTIYDNSGDAQTLNLTFTQSAAGAWTVSAAVPPPPAPTVSVVSSTSAAATIASSSATSAVDFDDSGAVSTGGTSTIPITWADGSTSTIDLDMSALTEEADTLTDGSISATADGSATSATANVTLTGTVPTDSPDPITTDVQVYDNSGTAQTVQLQMTEAADGGWNVTASIPPTVSFSGTGAVQGAPSATLDVTWPDGTVVPVTVDLSQLNQLSSSSIQTNTITQNGYAPGSLVSEQFNEQGDLYGVYSNGQKQLLYQLALAQFPNYDGLTETSNNLYLSNDYAGATTGSGAGSLYALPATSISPESLAASGSAGTEIVPDALEESNVDLGQQFTNMVIAQQAYNSASQAFKVADQMMETVRDLVT